MYHIVIIVFGKYLGKQLIFFISNNASAMGYWDVHCTERGWKRGIKEKLEN